MSKKNFTIDAAYAGYVYVGHAQGNFENDKGEKQSYFNIYVISPCSNYQSEDYMASGFKAEKLKCTDAEVWRDLDPGCKVKLFFDNKNRVQMIALDQ